MEQVRYDRGTVRADLFTKAADRESRPGVEREQFQFPEIANLKFRCHLSLSPHPWHTCYFPLDQLEVRAAGFQSETRWKGALTAIRKRPATGLKTLFE
jgi:hypothetical protein